MSRDYRRWEEPTSSRSLGYRRGYSTEYDRGRRTWPLDQVPPRGFNHWQDDPVMSTSYSSRRLYGRERESYDEERRYDDRPRYTEASHSRRRHDSGRGRHLDDRESRRGRSLPYQNSRQHRPGYTTPPRIPRTVSHTRDSIDSIPPPPQSEAPRKVSPSPNKSSQPLKPGHGYLSVSQEPSEVLQDPKMSRKLLVLDLNGSLLIRAPRSRNSSGPRLRAVRPRPYMQSFRNYLFCPETKEWLDTMVWSSAQPHSVDDMVDKVFGATKEELKAVWNRKSLGLSQAEYNQKTLTTKDLTKPLGFLAPSIELEKYDGRSTSHPPSRTIRSALTTLLLDDSPHKAVLQPYNHLCVPEYSSARRQRDLQSFLAAEELRKGEEHKKAKRKNQVEVPVHSPDEAVSEKEPYDVILLAVIGILDAVRLQSNVAGWIRKGGLWAAQERLEATALGVEHCTIAGAEDALTISETVMQTGNATSGTSDPAVTPMQVHLQTKMWFDDSSVVTYWVTRGRKVLMELGIQIVHGVSG